VSCESCIAARQAITASYQKALIKAKDLANETQQPVFLILENDYYTPTTTQQPNTVEVILPDK